MISIEYVPVQIIETGEKVKARIEIDPLKKKLHISSSNLKEYVITIHALLKLVQK